MGIGVERFWKKVDKSGGDGCWLWLGAKNSAKAGGHGLYQSSCAHRFAWALTYGAIPTGLYVLHRCDNPPCVNPRHLFLGTQLDNMHDMMRKGRARHHRKIDQETLAALCKAAAAGISERDRGKMFGISMSHAGNVVRKARRAGVAP